ncbi:MAG: metal-sulfur cluster assembly factor [Thermoplasmatales archaeon]|jgi:metal-sulfur cluster biosynthetic enzyme|nr:metal-sulfur cluster assembly factor [Thermoplasmatales archaeon]
MVVKEEIIKILKTVNDPEIGIDVVNLGLIYDLKVENDVVKIMMTMTAPTCPLTDWILFDVQKKVEGMKGVSKCDIELVWDPPWRPDMISEEARKMLNLDGQPSHS